MLNEFDKCAMDATGAGLYAEAIETIQVNVGLRCNQQCRHCHLAAAPHRAEMMDWATMQMVIEAAQCAGAHLVDITGGAPELNRDFGRFVASLRAKGFRVQVRSNLTVLCEPGMENMARFLRDHEVELVGSMPCYLEENVRAQRGENVYQRSIAALKMLSELGYGVEDGLELNLVYNPGGPFLPPAQASLEEDYRRELTERFGITFTKLLSLTNMPIGRFQEELRSSGQERQYVRLLRESFNPDTMDGLMCRRHVSVGWDGVLYDCDFNLALRSPVDHGVPGHIRRFEPSALAKRRIVTGEHYFGCTAGCGSSCSGALV